jgi:hypothetical protein
MTRKETLDYINNMDITELLKYDLRKYTNRLFDEYFETYDLIREGHYYIDHVYLLKECYIEYSTYLYALCRANIINKIDFYELEESAYNVFDLLQTEKY